MEGLNTLRNSKAWGVYQIGRYNFKINTDKEKEYYGIEYKKGDTNNHLISKESQKKLILDHFPAIIHEYIHYVHDVSTVVGIFEMTLDLSRKSLFSRQMSPNVNNSENIGLKGSSLTPLFARAHISSESLFGSFVTSGEKGPFLKLVDYNKIRKQTVNTPFEGGFLEEELEFPLLTYQFHDNGYYEDEIILGRFYLYEGIAYELDRIYEMNVKQFPKIRDDLRFSEYTVIRDVAMAIVPGIKTSSFLSLASMSLAQRNSGLCYIEFLKSVQNAKRDGISEEEALKRIKLICSECLRQMSIGIEQQLEEIAAIFSHREALGESFRYLTSQCLGAYKERVINPAFEVELLLSGNLNRLMEIISFCNYTLEFLPSAESGDGEFMRDMAVSLEEKRELSECMMSLQCYFHYYSSHLISSTAEIEAKAKPCPCPLFTICGLDIRKSNSEICYNKPWRTYELTEKTGGHCSYGIAIMEYKGTTRKSSI